MPTDIDDRINDFVPDFVKEAEQAMKEGKTFDTPQKEEVTIKFGRGLVDNFTSRSGKEMAAIKIPNPDPADHRPWESFVVPAKFVHENKFGKGVWMKLPADGTTELERPMKVADLPDGKQEWKSEYRTVSNTELKGLMESYKNKDRGSILDVLAGKKQEAKAAEAAAPKKDVKKKAEPAL